MLKKNKIRYEKRKTVLYIFILFLLVAALYSLRPAIVSFVIRDTSYADEINVVATTSGNFTWTLQNYGNLKSLKMDGSVTNSGAVRAYIENNGARYIIYSSNTSKNINESKGNGIVSSITAFVAKEEDKEKNETEENITITKEKNNAPDWTSNVDLFTINGTTKINLSEYFSDEDKDTLVYSVSETEGLTTAIENEVIIITPVAEHDFNTEINFTASDGIDFKTERVDLAVIAENKKEIIRQILIDLKYNKDSLYDENDDGIESIYGVVDLSVADTIFNFNYDENNLCTRWEILNEDELKATTVCYGNENCCAYLGLLPKRANWSEPYFALFGKDGVGYKNIISAQVISAEFNKTGSEGYTNVMASDWANLTASFFDTYTELLGVCEETCDLDNFNKTSYTIYFEVENATLRIDKLSYTIEKEITNNPPILIKNITDINLDDGDKINLSDYFHDPDNDILEYSYTLMDSVAIEFSGYTAIIKPGYGFRGATSTYITASDGIESVSSNLFSINPSLRPVIKKFIINNALNVTVVYIDEYGNALLNGQVFPNQSNLSPMPGYFIIKNASDDDVAFVGFNGLYLRGDVYQNSTLNESAYKLEIRNSKNEPVGYFDDKGNLKLKGYLSSSP